MSQLFTSKIHYVEEEYCLLILKENSTRLVIVEYMRLNEMI
jgi:hypothetical protein